MDYSTAGSNDSDRREPMQALASWHLIVVDAGSPEQTLRRVAERAKETLTGVEDVSVTLIE